MHHRPHVRKLVLPGRHALRLAQLTALLVGLLLALAVALPATAAPAAQTGQPLAVAKFETAYIRSGPSTNYPPVATLAYGQGCPVVGRDTFTGWWLVQCPNGIMGWVSFEVVTIQGDAGSVPLYNVGSAATVGPPEVQQPVQTSTGWRASYYANQDLAGTPVLVQDVPEINFNWGYGSPGPNVPADYFSARFERTLAVTPGNYTLTLRMDDGARVFVDDQLVIDDWRGGSLRQLQTVYMLGSNPRFRIEYFEAGSEASLYFSIAPLGGGNPTPPVQPTPAPWQPSAPDLAVTNDQWRAQFFNNTDVSGSPVAAQYEQRGFYPLDKYWGEASPAAGVPADYWSARFEGRFYFSLADYDFHAQSDDGVRVYIDDILIVDGWFDGYVDRSNRFSQVGEGYHTMRVDYYDRSGNAYVRVWWSYAGNPNPIPGPIPPPPTPY